MKKPGLVQVVASVCRLGLGALFIYSAFSKLSDPENFAYSVMRYRVLPDFTIGIFSLTMPMLELLAGLTMLFTKWLRESALLVAGMLALFIVALVQALVRGLEISCGCFGVPSVGGREEIVMALVRDIVLIVPAVWLMFRPNALLQPLARMSKGWRMACLCGVGLLLAAWFVKDTCTSGVFAPSLSPQTGVVMEAEPSSLPAETEGTPTAGLKMKKSSLAFSTGPIRPGEWNVDFNGVLEKAEREQRPMVLLQTSSGCAYCSRLEESIAGETFRLWCEDRAPLMAYVRAGSRVSPPSTVRVAKDFVKQINTDVKVPYVCVYWPQDGVTNRVAFSGRRGMMGGRKDKLLVVELMSALDQALGERLTTGRKTLEAIVRAAAAQISVRTEGEGGTVTMTPKDGLLKDGAQVALAAHPNVGHAFLDWRHPDGSLAGLETNLTVSGGMPVGCYTARFKSLSQCLPPLLVSPAEMSIRVKAKEPFSHEIRVDESCRPVKFRIKRPIAGIAVNPVTGIVTGTIPQAMTNTVEIAVIGYDPDRTEKTVRLTIEAFQRRLLVQKNRGGPATRKEGRSAD